MCGIVGATCPDGVDIDTFEKMRDELEHRGPDGKGLYLNDDGTTALGHRRLAIIGLSSKGNQPMANEDGTVYLVFNGEIYNYRSLRETLENCGHEFTSETDSEVILHGYEEWGSDCVERLRGMFSFGIYDENTDRTFLARDRAGIKPLFISDRDDRFLFASEPKAFLADDQFPREVDTVGLQYYLKYRYIPSPRTIWKDVKSVPPGCYAVVEGGSYEIEPYWDLSETEQSEVTDEETALSRVSETLRDAVQSHLVSDVPVGVLLSGGLDSSVVTALASQETDDLEAFTMGFDAVTDERTHARTVADEFDIDLTESTLDAGDLETLVDEVLYYYDQPLADSSIFPTFLLMESASEELKVVLSGDGGDEVFAGYRWYDWYSLYERLDPLAPVFSSAYRVVDKLGDYSRNELLSSAKRVLKPFTMEGFDRYKALMDNRFDDSEVASLTGKEAAFDEELVSRHAADNADVGDLQRLDFKTFMTDDILVKVDRASMAHSLEVRVPLLDHELVEEALSHGDSINYRDGTKKHLLKRLARQLLPNAIIDRPKEGFGVSLDEIGFLETYRSTLRDSRAVEDGVLDDEYVRKVLESGGSERKLTTLVLFELWYRRWVDV